MTTPKDEFEAMGAVDASRFDPALFNILQQVVTQRLHDIPVEMALYTLAVAVGGMQFMSPGRPEDAQKTVDDGMRHGDSSAKDARERKSTVPS